tara:strand:- start:289 stop:3543 length:3255 start_codon:yes stop_codon:yes gene_type:complete
MPEEKLILGAGGGGKNKSKGSRTPVEADDTLSSEQFASVLDLLCEGEIQGLDDDGKSIFLEDTPLQNADGSFNFDNFAVAVNHGTQGQSPIEDATSGVQVEVPVGVEVTNSSPVTRTVTNTEVDQVRITITIPSLQVFTEEGDIVGNSVEIQVQVQYNSGGYNTVFNDTISGKSSSTYQRDYLVPLTGSFPVDLRVLRVSADESSNKRASVTNWTSFTEIQTDKFAYPNSAVVGLRFSAKQFQSIPTRKYLIRGTKVRIPSNGTVDTTTHLGRITYSGLFDGTLSAATWTNDPAWCLFDLLTDTRYGCGIAESSLDVFDFYEISRYCSELVDDGKGGQEPRFSLNLLINTRDEVYNVIQNLTSIFRGIAYYGAGSLVLKQDKPADSQYLLGPSNVVDGLFTYSGAAEKVRHTCATVAWQSYDTLGDVEYEYVEDHEAVAKYGIINKEVKAIGCYSQGQAHRLGKWLLTSERLLAETVSFAVSIDAGIAVTPGVVIDIADPLRAGTRRSGRVSSATTTVITIDSDTNLSVDLSNDPTLSVLLPTGNVETRIITHISGAAITVNVPFSQAPQAEAIYLIQTTDIQSQQYRVISVAEGDDGTVGVTAIAYNESIYDFVEQDIALTTRDISNLSLAPDPPTNITGTELIYEEGQSVHVGFDLSWQSSRVNVSDFVVKYRIDNDNFTEIRTTNPSVTLRTLRAGTLTVQVRAAGNLLKESAPAKATFNLAGKTALPGNVQNLTLEPLSHNNARLRWDEAVDLDVKVSGKVHIRHSNLTNGTATWANSTDLIAAVAGSSTEATVPLLEGEYLVKFEDDGLRKSATEASVIVDQPVSQTFFGVKTQREDQLSTPFDGSKTDTTYDSTYDALILDSDGLTAGTGEYAFDSTLDLEAVYSLDLERRLVSRGIYPTDLWDSRTDNIDTWQDIDGGVPDAVNAELYVRKTNDDPSSSPTYSAWQPLVNAVLKARAFQFKAVLTSSDTAQNVLVDELGYKAQFQQRTEQSTATIASGTSAKAVTFTNAFFTGTTALGGANSALPTIGITPLNMATGDFFELSSISRTGFTVTFKNSSGTIVDRNFNYMATGFGKAG